VPETCIPDLSISGEIFNFVVNLIGSTGYAGIFILMVLEGATFPVPSEVILPFAGYLVFQGKLDFWIVVLVATLGAIIGTLIDYSIGYYLGRAAILRYGKYVRLNENHLKTSERWFARHGNITVFGCQFVPLIRTLVAFPAGISEMKLWKFVLYAAAGTFIWNTVLVYAGDLAGQNSSEIISALSSAFNLIEILVVIVLIVLFAVLWTRRSRRADNRS
jgi:membrane protein DedA with SNARE-associated domain